MRGAAERKEKFSESDLQNVPVARFNLEREVFSVFPSGNGLSEGPFLSVGEMIIAGKRFIIVRGPENDEAAESNGGTAVTDMLSRREIQIVALVAEGRVNKQIAHLLKISEWTVSTHLRRIFAKLGVDSRAAMVYRCSGLF